MSVEIVKKYGIDFSLYSNARPKLRQYRKQVSSFLQFYIIIFCEIGCFCQSTFQLFPSDIDIHIVQCLKIIYIVTEEP